MQSRHEAARLQKIESDHLKVLWSNWTRARIRIWTMAEFIEAPMEHLQTILGEIGPASPHRLSEVPRLVDLAGFGHFLRSLRNDGMHPYLAGTFPLDRAAPSNRRAEMHRPYLVH